ncbi:hypothetical protein F5Y19DRAFT_5533 [Xylariaceae sp. FL1651]|nr:hypothetical protein F5Y19DRAFT_5533 [Xylariaceae sp. FL1651]
MAATTDYDPPNPPQKVGPGLSVIHASLFRMGTRSMTAAYRTLGYRVDHGMDNRLNPWELLEEAAEATFPHAPDVRPRPPHTREDWDRLWGNEFDIATDLGSVFSLEFIKAYPNAKVVVVQRDFEPWFKSFTDGPLSALFGPIPELFLALAYYGAGSRVKFAMHKLLLGFFHAKDRAEIDANARETYDNYFKTVRAMVPPENLLEYKLGDGWEPLCEFLGKPVPDMPFPRLNDQASHAAHTRKKYREIIDRCVKKFGPYVMASAGIGVAMTFANKLQ